MRWQHPQQGILLPDRFINVAEQTGLIRALGRDILKIACQQLSTWRHKLDLDCNVSVNVSARQFNDAELVNDIKQLLDEFKLDANWLEIEVTESMLLDNIDQSIRTLQALRDLGLRIALDDFGTGYSSLSYLKVLPIDTLKIDQSFVRELPTDEKTTVITLSLLEMAKGLGLTVVAEGVETQEQYDFLVCHGVDLIQGYIVSRPVEALKFQNLFFKPNTLRSTS